MEKINMNKDRFTTNVIRGEDLESSINGVSEIVSRTLIEHCGPNSQFATVFGVNGTGAITTKFTKDGIGILRSMEFNNPIDEMIMSLFKNIGHGMESKAGDGTTSSVIIALQAISSLRAAKELLKPVNYNQFVTTFTKVCDDLESKIKELAIVPSATDRELIKGIAYHQGMTSSHGDVEVSKVVSELVSKVHPQALKHLIYRAEPIETSERYRLEVFSANYKCPAHLWDQHMYNSTLGDAVEYESCTMVAPPYSLSSNSTAFGDLKRMLAAHTPEDEPLAILVPMMDSAVIQELTNLYHVKRREGCTLSIFNLRDGIVPRCDDLTAIFAICDVDNVMNDPGLLIKTNAKIDFKYEQLSIENVCEYDDEDMHLSLSKEGSPLHRLVMIIDNAIVGYEQQKNLRADVATLVSGLQRIRNSISYRSLANIVIGGAIYEQQANEDVIKDVLQAVRESILSGVTLGGFKGLHIAAYNPTDTKLSGTIKEVLHLGMHNVNSVFDWVNIDFTRSQDASKDGIPIDLNVDTLKELDDMLVVQSVTSYSEFFKRLKDTVPRMVYTNKLIIPNVTNNEDNYHG